MSKTAEDFIEYLTSPPYDHMECGVETGRAGTDRERKATWYHQSEREREDGGCERKVERGGGRETALLVDWLSARWD